MTNTWYPVVDVTKCMECGTCADNCGHGVFDYSKSPVPVIIRAVECIVNCRKCGEKCPNGAITYVGDNSGWIPPALKGKEFKESTEL